MEGKKFDAQDDVISICHSEAEHSEAEESVVNSLIFVS